MTISLVYTIVIIVIIVCVSRGVKGIFFGLFTLLAAMEVNRITSSALSVASQEINCSDIVLAALFVCSIMLILQQAKIERKLLAGGIVVLALATVSLTYNLLFPYEGTIITSSGSWDGLLFGVSKPEQVEIGARSVLVLIRLAIFVIVAWCASSVLVRNDFMRAASYVLLLSKAQILFGIFELLTKSVLGSSVAVEISNYLFPSFSSAVTDIVIRGDMTVLQGFTREPSHFAVALSFSLIILVVLNCAGRGRKFDLFWGIAALALLSLSGAFTAMVGIAIVAIVCFRYRDALFARVDKRVQIAACLLFVVVSLLSMAVLTGGVRIGEIYYVDKFSNVVDNIDAIVSRQYGGLTGSYDALPRIVSMVECLRAFLESPIFGIGPGVVNPFSGISAILSQYGLLLTVVWFAFLVTYGQSLGDRRGGRFLGVVVLLYGLLLFGGGYEYTFTWILLGGLLSTNTAAVQENNRREQLQDVMICNQIKAGIEKLGN